MDIIALLKAEHDKSVRQVNALDTAIKALSGVNSTGGSRGPRRRISAEGLANIRAAQRARRTRETGQKVVSMAPKRHISPAGLARIRAAQRARWAKVKGQQKVVSITPKRRISAAGLARIRAANRARWAKMRATKK
jgi:hypothetical protein